MNNPFRNLVKKPAKHEKGEIVVADSGNVKEVAKIMIGCFIGIQKPAITGTDRSTDTRAARPNFRIT